MKVVGYVAIGVLALVALSFVGCVAGVITLPGWFASRSVEVVKQQIDPGELLRKYELFKDESAQLDAKVADIRVKEKQIARVRSLKNPDRTDREQLLIEEQELAGIKYSYNALAADYNAQMAKINYAFCNQGSLPAGATTPLPREYKPYVEE